MVYPPASLYHRLLSLAPARGWRRPTVAAPIFRMTPRADFTLQHGGRQVRLGPVTFWVAVGTLVIMGLWTITTATYFAFRDDVLTRLMARQADMQFGYEDRIAELRSQVDRVSSRQLLDQEQYEQKLDEILRRQSMLESRAAALGGATDPTSTGSVKPTTRNGASSMPMGQPLLKPSPISDTAVPEPPRDREARASTPFSGPTVGNSRQSSVDAILRRVQGSLDRLEARQSTALSSMEESIEAKAKRIRSVLSDLGIDPNKAANVSSPGGVGGPFVSARLPADATAFDRQLYRVNLVRAQLERLTHTVGNLPVRRPVLGQTETASGFGVRIDPFLHAPAMHTGLDLKSEIGDPVRATANGTVTTAGWSGGYGKMVEVDHGNGFATRYGHLSAIDVQVGQIVKLGQLIGKVGSTGRSTGAHLHYETRVDGEPVDPQKFFRAGSKLVTAN